MHDSLRSPCTHFIPGGHCGPNHLRTGLAPRWLHLKAKLKGCELASPWGIRLPGTAHPAFVLKGIFREVGLWSATSTRSPAAPTPGLLGRDLFGRLALADFWHLPSTRSRDAFANIAEAPELIFGRSDEKGHGAWSSHAETARH